MKRIDLSPAKTSSSALILFALISIAGCSTGPEGGAEKNDLAARGVPLEVVTDYYPAPTEDATDRIEQKDCTIGRDDVFGWDISLGNGHFGAWATCYSMCPANSFVYSVQVKSEPKRGSGDDTAMNGIRFACYDRTTGGYRGWIESYVDDYGSWMGWVNSNPYSTANPFIAGNLKIEAKQGSGDDTAANKIRMNALSGTVAEPPANTDWGTWAALGKCPVNTAVCGFKTRIDFDSGDNTALNGAQVACCTFNW